MDVELPHDKPQIHLLPNVGFDRKLDDKQLKKFESSSKSKVRALDKCIKELLV